MLNIDIENKWVSIYPEIFDDLTRIIFAVHGINRADCEVDYDAIRSLVPGKVTKAFPPQLIHDVIADDYEMRTKACIDGECSVKQKTGVTNRTPDMSEQLARTFLKDHESFLNKLYQMLLRIYIFDYYRNCVPEGLPESWKDGGAPTIFEAPLIEVCAGRLASIFSAYWTLDTLAAAHRPKVPNRSKGGRARVKPAESKTGDSPDSPK